MHIKSKIFEEIHIKYKDKIKNYSREAHLYSGYNEKNQNLYVKNLETNREWYNIYSTYSYNLYQITDKGFEVLYSKNFSVIPDEIKLHD